MALNEFSQIEDPSTVCWKNSQFYKTKVCPWYFKNKCGRGVACRFAHSNEELRSLPDLAKTSLCPSIGKREACRREGCRFAHSHGELRATEDFYKRTLCFMWMRGRCDAGRSCRHAHGVHELRNGVLAPPKDSCPETTCYNYQKRHTESVPTSKMSRPPKGSLLRTLKFTKNCTAAELEGVLSNSLPLTNVESDFNDMASAYSKHGMGNGTIVSPEDLYADRSRFMIKQAELTCSTVQPCFDAGADLSTDNCIVSGVRSQSMPLMTTTPAPQEANASQSRRSNLHCEFLFGSKTLWDPCSNLTPLLSSQNYLLAS